MKKILAVLLMLNLLLLLLSGCTEELSENNPQLIDEAETFVAELVHEENTEHITEIEAVTTPEPSPEPIQIVEVSEIQRDMDNPQTIISTPTETPNPTATPTSKPSQTATPTPRPTQSTTTTPQAPSQTSTPAPQLAPEPAQQSTPQPQPTPEPIPQPTPPPIPEPPLARTICNTCGADITGNVPAHGTMHLHNDENFSYRVE